MILYLTDWEKYPNAIIHTSTTNESFVRLAGLYKKMGVKNNAFMLALHDPDLKDVDPHSPNLDTKTIAKITIECKVNFWYFIREIAKAPAVSGTITESFKANRGNIALYWLFHNNITVCLEQIRQTGKTFAESVLTRWLLNIRCNNTLINLLTKDSKLRTATLDSLRKIENVLPAYFKLTKDVGFNKDIFNTEALTVKLLGNKYMGHVPQKAVMDAINQGRGLTSPIFLIDEIAFINNIQYSLPSALAGGGFARDAAEKNDEPYGTIITSTAGRLDTDSGAFSHNLMTESAIWTEQYYDLQKKDNLIQTIRKQSSNDTLRVYCKFNHRQLGYTDEWLKKKIEESLASGDLMRMDWFGEWVIGSNTNPLPLDVLDKIKEGERKDYAVVIDDNGYVTRWFIPINEIDTLRNHTGLVLGLDTSEAIGKDDIALCLRDIYSGKVYAVGNYNETNLITFSEWLLQWFIKFNGMVAMIERKSTGGMIIDYLLKYMITMDINPFKRIFNWVVDEHLEHADRYARINSESIGRNNLHIAYKKQFGFATSGSGKTSRDRLYTNLLLPAAQDTGHLIYDPNTISQISTLVVKNSRIDHTTGAKDDLVVAWLLTHYFILNVKNAEYYGIDKFKILHSLNDDVSFTNMSNSDIYIKKKESAIVARINHLLELFDNARDAIKKSRLEREIRHLSHKATTSAITGYNADATLEKIKQINKQFRR